MDYKAETKKAYDAHAKELEKKYRENFELRSISQAKLFLKYLKGKKILDVGSGPGVQAQFFKEQGFDVLCIDISEEMVELCKAKGLNAQVGDMEYLDFPDNSFDAIWVYASLLHIPKANAPKVVEKLTRMLKPEGLIALAVKEGMKEGFEADDEQHKRWFAYYTDEEIKILFNKLERLHASRTPVNNKFVFLNYIFRKSPQ